MRSRLALVAALSTPAVIAALGCYRDRERLDVPVLNMTTEVDSVSPGDTLRGTLEARDQSGLILVRLLATYRADTASAEVDTVRLRYDVPELRDVQIDFSIEIPGASPVGGRVALVAAAFDDQDFQVETTDTLWVVP